MDKTKLQNKFRLVLVIASALVFLTLLLPAYIKYNKTSTAPTSVIMMWTVIFGVAKNKSLDGTFEFSWIGFIPYLLIIILLIIALTRKFVSVDASQKQTKALNQTLDVINLVMSIISLLLFIALPIVLASGSNQLVKLYVTNKYGFGISLIVCYILTTIMIVSSAIVLSADTILKVKKLKDSKKNTQE